MTFERSAFKVLDEALAEELEAIRQVVCMCIALDAEPALRLLVLRGTASRDFAQPHGSVSLLVTHKGATLSRAGAGDVEPIGVVEMLTETALNVAAGRLPNWRRYGKKADRMLDGLLDGERSAFRELLNWAPVVERIAYRASARISTMLDEDRGVIVGGLVQTAAEHKRMLRRYWSLASLMARLTLLATTPGASAWLVDMSRSFVWSRWTPSVGLVRERLSGFAAIAGRAAAEFGPPVLDDYAEALERSRHPTLILDAVLGIAAIAIGHPSARDDARQILSAYQRSLARRDRVEDRETLLGLRQAIGLIETSEKHRFSGTAPPRDFYADAFEFATNGECPALAALPTALTHPAWTFLPPRRSPMGRAVSEELGEAIFTRAWGAGVRPAQERVLH